MFLFLAAGILIDIDHVIDYYLQQGVTLKFRAIYDWFISGRFWLVFIFFHSLEFLFLFWAAVWFYRLGLDWVFFGLGLTQHLVLDLISNRGFKPYGYFLTYRIIKRFRKEDIFI